MKTCRDKYSNLPEARTVPDSVWECDRIIAHIKALQDAITMETLELNFSHQKMISDLRKNWSDEEIRKAGLME